MVWKIHIKKSHILLGAILLLITICCLLYPRVLFNSSVKNEVTEHLEKLNFEVITEQHLSEYFQYLDSSEKYDYYCVAEYESANPSVVSTYLCKLQNNTVISKYELADLSENSLMYVQNGICAGNYLYFTVCGINAIYRIDVNFSSCELYLESSEYGNVSYSTLSLYGDDLMYITDTGSIVKCSDANEELVLTVPTLKSVFGNDAINFNSFLSQYNYAGTANYQICTDKKRMFCAAKNKLFVYNAEESELEEISIRLPESAYIQKIKFSKENENILLVFYTVYSAPWEAKTNHIVACNVKTGKKRVFQQKQDHQFREWLVHNTGDGSVS